MLPVIRARLMMACAVRVDSWPWFTPIVHQNETRCSRVDRGREPFDVIDGEAAGVADPFGGERSNVLGEVRESGGVLVDVCLIDPAFARQHVRHPVEQRQIRLRRERKVLCGGHSRLGGPRIHHDDLGRVRVAAHALPQNRVCDAQVRPDQDDHVGLLEVGIGIRRRVEAERLFVSDDRCGHALAGVAVTVDHAHAELRQRAEERHLFGRDLTGREKGRRLGSVRVQYRPKSVDESGHGGFPPDGVYTSAPVAPQGCGSPIVGAKWRQGLPPLRAGHAQVHRVIASWV